MHKIPTGGAALLLGILFVTTPVNPADARTRHTRSVRHTTHRRYHSWANTPRSWRRGNAGQWVTVRGRVTGLDTATRTFAVVNPYHDTPVNAWGARFTYGRRRANIYRLMGSPRVLVTGRWIGTRMVRAARVDIISRSTARLMPSHRTRLAQPGPLLTH